MYFGYVWNFFYFSLHNLANRLLFVYSGHRFIGASPELILVTIFFWVFFIGALKYRLCPPYFRWAIFGTGTS